MNDEEKRDRRPWADTGPMWSAREMEMRRAEREGPKRRKHTANNSETANPRTNRLVAGLAAALLIWFVWRVLK